MIAPNDLLRVEYYCVTRFFFFFTGHIKKPCVRYAKFSV